MNKEINNNIQEVHCSFEVSKLLKEKGFKQPTLCYYFEDGIFVQNSYKDITGMDYGKEFEIEYEELLSNWNDNFVTKKNGNRCLGCDKSKGYFETYSAPTLDLAIEWIRVNFDINIWVDCDKEGKYLWTTNIIKEGYYVQSDDWIEELENIEEDYYETPQKAKEMAILYTLKNLI